MKQRRQTRRLKGYQCPKKQADGPGIIFLRLLCYMLHSLAVVL